MWIRKGMLLRRGGGGERGGDAAIAGGSWGGGRGPSTLLPSTALGAGPNRQTAVATSNAMSAVNAAIATRDVIRRVGLGLVRAAGSVLGTPMMK
jgi:hypothetical protein